MTRTHLRRVAPGSLVLCLLITCTAFAGSTTALSAEDFNREGELLGKNRQAQVNERRAHR